MYNAEKWANILKKSWGVNTQQHFYTTFNHFSTTRMKGLSGFPVNETSAFKFENKIFCCKTIVNKWDEMKM